MSAKVYRAKRDMEGISGVKFGRSKGTVLWGILGTGAGIGRNGDISLAKDMKANGNH